MNGIDIRQVNFTCNDEVYLAMTGLFSLSELVALSMNSFSFSFRSSNLNTDLYLNLFFFWLRLHVGVNERLLDKNSDAAEGAGALSVKEGRQKSLHR